MTTDALKSEAVKLVPGDLVGLDAMRFSLLRRMAEKGNPFAGLLARVVA